MAPDEFIRVADELLKIRDGREIHHRCAVSRAYYGVYHMALNFAIGNLGYQPPAGGLSSHATLASYFLGKTDETLVTIGRELRAIHGHRIKADYRLKNFYNKNNATLAVAQTKLLAAEISKKTGNAAQA